MQEAEWDTFWEGKNTRVKLYAHDFDPLLSAQDTSSIIISRNYHSLLFFGMPLISSRVAVAAKKQGKLPFKQKALGIA